MTIETAPVAATVPTANQDDAEVIHIPEIVGYLKSIGDQCPGPGAIVTGNELLNKLGSGDSLSDVDKINVREIAKDERSKYMSQYLRFSYIVYWVERKDLWREWGYDSFDDYFELELGLSSSSKSRYLRAFPVYCKLRQFAQVSVAEAKVPSLSSLEELAGLFGRINVTG